jgi:TIR domain
MSNPRLFVSYCWSTPDHEQWVIDLASELTQSGVEVILDKWDLREGHDAVAFMEKMVTDPTIKKVLIVCDRVYAEKADGRKGGVGTETQIISREVYESTSQDKFAAVVAERDGSGKPYLPTYYKSRIYIDLSEAERYAENFEKLLRWVYDKPLFAKPELGKPPSFVTDAGAKTLGTSVLARRSIDGVKNDKGYARGAFEEYLSTFAENIERFRINPKDGELDELIVSAIDAFTPARNEFLQVLLAQVQYGSSGGSSTATHRFLEALLPYYSNLETQNSWNELEADHFKFIVHELFLYVIAIYLRAEDFDSVSRLLAEPYYVPRNAERGRDVAASFTTFRSHMRSLDYRNQHLKLNRLSLRADLLEQRAKSSGMQFRLLMQADFICFIRAELTETRTSGGWWPETLLYANRQYGAFEIFARAVSKTYLIRLLPVLGVSSTAPIAEKLGQFANDRRSLPRWQFESFAPAVLMGFDSLGTKP